jgi:hypothetical protein
VSAPAEQRLFYPNSIPCPCLPGYQLVRCLGQSRNGEVWKALAPDGRTRAIKFIYPLAGTQAFTLQAVQTLTRLKLLTHPGLTRVDKVLLDDGRLVLVTDLGDLTLRERFEACQARGWPGIPREELLDYLGQAAAALDEAAQLFDLHHLALGPRQLLLTDETVQVADVGLVQLLWIPAGQSLARLNPRYAAPELAGERFARTTDQFSLAVLYQEMLTGMLPHRGYNTRQLLQARAEGRLDLDPLPAADRPAVARALRPDPRDRFPTCTEFIQALRAPADTPSPPPGLALPAGWVLPGGQRTSAPPLEQVIDGLVRSAADSFQVGEFHGIRYLVRPDGRLCHRCAAWLPEGVARRKLEGFFQRWNASLVHEETGFFVFHLALSRNLWRRLFDSRPHALAIELQLFQASAQLTEVTVVMRYLGHRHDEGRRMLDHLAPTLLSDLHNHLLATPERRVRERFAFPHELRVLPVYRNLQPGEPIAGVGKDISTIGIGLFTPEAPPTSQVYICPDAADDAPAFVIPAAVTRVQRREDGCYELGARFVLDKRF